MISNGSLILPLTLCTAQDNSSSPNMARHVHILDVHGREEIILYFISIYI